MALAVSQPEEEVFTNDEIDLATWDFLQEAYPEEGIDDVHKFYCFLQKINNTKA